MTNTPSAVKLNSTANKTPPTIRTEKNIPQLIDCVHSCSHSITTANKTIPIKIPNISILNSYLLIYNK